MDVEVLSRHSSKTFTATHLYVPFSSDVLKVAKAVLGVFLRSAGRVEVLPGYHQHQQHRIEGIGDVRKTFTA
jgi:hypothetical protein